MLTTLVRAWRAGMDTPRPVAVKTALAWLRAPSPEEAPRAARATYEATHDRAHGELDNDPYLLRAFPDFASLLEAGFADCLDPYRDFLGALRVEVS
jgi:exodeoxyribonuclease V gamma subunit